MQDENRKLTFEEIVSGPELDELAALGAEFDALEGEVEEFAETLGTDEVEGEVEETGAYLLVDSEDDDLIAGVDVYGNEVTLAYCEFECEEHGTEASIALSVNDSGSIFPVETLSALSAWIDQRIAKARDKGLCD